MRWTPFLISIKTKGRRAAGSLGLEARRHVSVRGARSPGRGAPRQPHDRSIRAALVKTALRPRECRAPGRGRCRPEAPRPAAGRRRRPCHPGGSFWGEKGRREHGSHGPSEAGEGGAPPRARRRPRPPLPFWERIASPVLRSPNTDKGPSIFAAGHTSSFTHTAGSKRLAPGPGGGHSCGDCVELA